MSPHDTWCSSMLTNILAVDSVLNTMDIVVEVVRTSPYRSPPLLIVSERWEGAMSLAPTMVAT